MRFFAVLLLAIAAFPLSRAYAESRGDEMAGPDGHEHGAMQSGWKDSLTDDQRAEIDLSHLRLSQKQALLRAQIGLKRAEINLLIASEDADQENLRRKFDELAALEKERMTNDYLHIMEVRQLLTPRQRVAFDLSVLTPRPTERN